MKKRIKIRLVLKSYDHQLLDKATKQIVLTARKTGAEVVGPVPLPNRLHVETVLRSPHIDKKSREQFGIITHHRLLEIVSPTESTMTALMQISISAGVDVQVVNN